MNKTSSEPLGIRLLYLESDEAEARCSIEALREGGCDASVRRVSLVSELREAIAGESFDLVLLGHTYSDAMRLLEAETPDTPAILLADCPCADSEDLTPSAGEVVYRDRRRMLAAAARRAVGRRMAEESREQAESALRAASNVLTALIRCAPLPIAVVDRDGTVDVWNPAAERVLGWSREEILGCSLDGVLNGEGKGLSKTMRAVLEAESASGVELRQRTKNGPVIDMLVNTAPLTSENNEVRGAVAIMTDVTERNRVREAFRESKERFQSAFLHAPIGMAIATSAGKLLRVNPAFCRMLGYPEDRLLTMAWLDLVHPDDRGRFDSGSPQSLSHCETRFLHSEGRTVYVQWNMSMVGEGAAAARYTIGQVVDMTGRYHAEQEIKRYAAELERSNADLQHFAYVASHDLQEPLRMIRGFLDLLARRYEGQLDERADEYIGFAVDGATRMQNLIHALLTYSRVGTRAKAPGPVELEQSFSDATMNLKTAIEEADAKISHDPLPSVVADSTQVTLLLQNLLSNAIKFRAERPVHVSVRVADEGNMWKFAVADNGIGLDTAQAGRMFQMFQRLHAPSEYPGTGIGLALCKRIVERHGGTIWVDSNLGEGATFHFTLPKQPVPAG